MATAAVGALLLAPGHSYRQMPMTAATRFWDLPTSSRIAYTYTGPPVPSSQPPVIVVHGGPGAPDVRQDPLAHALAAAGFDVYIYQQVGSGLSSRLPNVYDYTLARDVADLDAIRAKLGASKIILVGNSFGGKLTANYMAVHPDRVAKAVISSPIAIWSPAFKGTGGLTAGGSASSTKALNDTPELQLVLKLLNLAGPQAVSALVPERTLDRIAQDYIGNLDMSAGCQDGHAPEYEKNSKGVGFWALLATDEDSRTAPDPRPALRKVTAPVLVLRAKCDYVSWNVTREYRDLVPNAVLLPIPDAGHRIHINQPEEYQQAVRSFLLGKPLPAAPYTGEEAPW
ncbi:alpha/beta fold hydrolase [Kitasatospora sp. NPDC059571]|uniref:alpha/beta fold hydrolase n=1 Tax=Kitasatospora sp. NPDC059571 TaxID=3346871 RepID=UPI00367B9780